MINDIVTFIVAVIVSAYVWYMPCDYRRHK